MAKINAKEILTTLTVILVTALVFGGGIYIFMNRVISINKKVIEDQNRTIEKQREYQDIVNEEELSTYIDVSASETKELIDGDANLIVLDVSDRHSEGHIPTAVNYYVGDGSLDEAIPQLDKNKTYLVYCHVDSASILGAQKLVDAGFKKVYRLEGNYQAWIDAGYLTEK